MLISKASMLMKQGLQENELNRFQTSQFTLQRSKSNLHKLTAGDLGIIEEGDEKFSLEDSKRRS